MKAPNRILTLSPAEYQLMCHYLLCYRNQLIAEGNLPGRSQRAFSKALQTQEVPSWLM